jgi:acetylornithine deacetylase
MDELLNQAQNDAIQLLQRLITIPSYSREENDLADFLEKHIEIMGYVAGRKDNNVWILSPAFDYAKPTILLNSHIDTVKPSDKWTYNPHVASIENGRIYGLGSNDAGASLVSLLYTFFLLTSKEQPYNLIFAASAEEEVSGKKGIESLIKELPRIDIAVVGEPTGMQMAIAEKGLMVVDCVAHGKSGHAAREEGINAIYNAIEDIRWIQKNELPKKSDVLGPVRMSVTMIESGSQHNVIPDKCNFVIDVRSNECYSNREIFDILKENLTSDLTARSFRLSSSGISVRHPIVKRGLSLGLKTFGSPTLSDQALMPFPSVKIGPGESARSHTSDEFITLDEIRNAIEVYFNLLNELKL